MKGSQLKKEWKAQLLYSFQRQEVKFIKHHKAFIKNEFSAYKCFMSGNFQSELTARWITVGV